MTSGCVLVNQSFASCAVEKLHGRDIVLTAVRRLLEGGAKRGALSPVARHSGSGLTHVLFRGRDIRHFWVSILFDIAGSILLSPADLAVKASQHRISKSTVASLRNEY